MTLAALFQKWEYTVLHTLKSCMISYLKVCDLSSDIMGLWYHNFLISYMHNYDIIDDIITSIDIDVNYDVIIL